MNLANKWNRIIDLVKTDQSYKGLASRDMVVDVLNKLYDNASEITLEVLKKTLTVWLQMYDNVIVHKIDAIDCLVSDYRRSVSIYILFNDLQENNVAIIHFLYDLPVKAIDVLDSHISVTTIIDVSKFLAQSTCNWFEMYEIFDYDKLPKTAIMIRESNTETIWIDNNILYRRSAYWGHKIDTNRNWYINYKMKQASEFAEANSHKLFMAKYEFENEIYNIPTYEKNH